MKKSNKRFLRALAFLLVLALSLSLIGCGGKNTPPEKLQEGIVISPEVPYSAATVAYAKETLYPLVLRFVENGGLLLTDTLRAHYREVAAEVAEILCAEPVAEPLFLSAMDAIGTRGAAVVDELYAYAKKSGTALTETAALYRALVLLLDSEAVLRAFYNLVIYSYSYRYEDAMLKYSEFKKIHFLREAQAIRTERAVFTEEIGEAAFCAVIGRALCLSDLFFGGALESGQLDSFSDGELLAFLRRLDVEPLSVSDAGWELILSLIAPEKAADAQDHALWIAALLKKNGDLSAVAAVCNDMTAVGAALVAHLGEESLALLRRGEYEAAVASSLADFTEQEWLALARVQGMAIDRDAYHGAALEKYGDAYLAYAESLVPLTAEGLCESLGTENFYESLERIVGGISPAFSYGMKQ